MQLVLKIQKTKSKTPAPVEVILKTGKKIICKGLAKNPEKILSTLDRILKKHKIVITNIGSIKTVDNLNKNCYTSFRVTRSIEKALKFGLTFKPN